MRIKWESFSLLTLALAILGLSFAGFWTNNMGYGSEYLPAVSLSNGSMFARIAFLFGIAVSGVFIVCNNRLALKLFSKSVYCAICGAASVGAFVYAIAWRQTFFEPVILGSMGALTAGIAYYCLVIAFYYVLAQNYSFKTIAFAVSLSLVAELCISPTLNNITTDRMQVIFAILLPLGIGALYFLLDYLSENALHKDSFDHPKDKDQPVSVLPQNLYMQAIIAALAIVVLRALSTTGIWGGERFDGIPSWENLLVSSASLLLLSYIAFMFPRNLKQYRFIPAFLLLSIGFLALAIKGNFIQENTGIADALLDSLVSFSHLTLWMVIVYSFSLYDDKLTVAGVGGAAYGLLSILWIVVFEPLNDVFTAVLFVIIYVVAFVLLLTAFMSTHTFRQAQLSSQLNETPTIQPISQSNAPDSTEKQKNSSQESPYEDAIAQISVSKGLSPRETEVLQQLMKGKTQTAIAQELCIAESTVKTHVLHIYEKLEIHGRSELFALIASIASSPS